MSGFTKVSIYSCKIDNFENSQKPDLTKEEPVQWNFQDIVNSDGNIPQNEDKSINKKNSAYVNRTSKNGQ